MKFPQLAIGARFTFEGKTYTKTGPLTACEQAGGKSQLMRKSAVVEPLDQAQEPARRELRQYSETEVRRLCDDYRGQLRERFSQLAGDAGGLSIDQVLELLDDPSLPLD